MNYNYTIAVEFVISVTGHRAIGMNLEGSAATRQNPEAFL